MEDQKTTYTLTKGQAAAKCLCPRCRTGEVFQGKLYRKGGQKMNENCPHCHMRFEREPGYFYVAMFVSYALNVAEIVTACLGIYILTGIDDNFWLYLGVVLGIVFIMAPFNYRYSRIILMYWLTPGLRFVPSYANKDPKAPNAQKN
jgi:uncharacterized protein (DUF983 family)